MDKSILEVKYNLFRRRLFRVYTNIAPHTLDHYDQLNQKYLFFPLSMIEEDKAILHKLMDQIDRLNLNYTFYVPFPKLKRREYTNPRPVRMFKRLSDIYEPDLSGIKTFLRTKHPSDLRDVREHAERVIDRAIASKKEQIANWTSADHYKAELRLKLYTKKYSQKERKRFAVKYNVHDLIDERKELVKRIYFIKGDIRRWKGRLARVIEIIEIKRRTHRPVKSKMPKYKIVFLEEKINELIEIRDELQEEKDNLRKRLKDHIDPIVKRNRILFDRRKALKYGNLFMPEIFHRPPKTLLEYFERYCLANRVTNNSCKSSSLNWCIKVMKEIGLTETALIAEVKRVMDSGHRLSHKDVDLVVIGKTTAIPFTQVALTNKVFVSCSFIANRIERGTWEGVVFIGCLLDKLNISGAKLVRCTFICCQFDNTDLRQTKFTDCRFLSCKIVDIQVEKENFFNQTFVFCIGIHKKTKTLLFNTKRN